MPRDTATQMYFDTTPVEAWGALDAATKAPMGQLCETFYSEFHACIARIIQDDDPIRSHKAVDLKAEIKNPETKKQIGAIFHTKAEREVIQEQYTTEVIKNVTKHNAVGQELALVGLKRKLGQEQSVLESNLETDSVKEDLPDSWEADIETRKKRRYSSSTVTFSANDLTIAVVAAAEKLAENQLAYHQGALDAQKDVIEVQKQLIQAQFQVAEIRKEMAEKIVEAQREAVEAQREAMRVQQQVIDAKDTTSDLREELLRSRLHIERLEGVINNRAKLEAVLSSHVANRRLGNVSKSSALRNLVGTIEFSSKLTRRMDMAKRKGIHFDQTRVQNDASNLYMILSGNGPHNVGDRSKIVAADFSDISQALVLTCILDYAAFPYVYVAHDNTEHVSFWSWLDTLNDIID